MLTAHGHCRVYGRRAHPADKVVDFVNFETDGWVTSRHRGLMDDGTVTSRRAHLFSVLNGEAGTGTDFLVRSVVTPEDEVGITHTSISTTPRRVRKIF